MRRSALGLFSREVNLSSHFPILSGVLSLLEAPISKSSLSRAMSALAPFSAATLDFGLRNSDSSGGRLEKLRRCHSWHTLSGSPDGGLMERTKVLLVLDLLYDREIAERLCHDQLLKNTHAIIRAQ